MTCLRPQQTVPRPGLELETHWSVVRDTDQCASPPTFGKSGFDLGYIYIILFICNGVFTGPWLFRPIALIYCRFGQLTPQAINSVYSKRNTAVNFAGCLSLRTVNSFNWVTL